MNHYAVILVDFIAHESMGDGVAELHGLAHPLDECQVSHRPAEAVHLVEEEAREGGCLLDLTLDVGVIQCHHDGVDGGGEAILLVVAFCRSSHGGECLVTCKFKC